MVDHVARADEALFRLAVSYSRAYVGAPPAYVAAGVLPGLASGWVGFRLAFGVRRSRKSPSLTLPGGKDPRIVGKYNTYPER